jgi:hypothetical protein
MCDVAPNDALCDNLQDFHILVANKHRIVFWRTLSVRQWYRMSIAFDRFCLIVSLTMPYAVELSGSRALGLCVAQLGKCDSERGATLGVVEARSSF